MAKLDSCINKKRFNYGAPSLISTCFVTAKKAKKIESVSCAAFIFAFASCSLADVFVFMLAEAASCSGSLGFASVFFTDSRLACFPFGLAAFDLEVGSRLSCCASVGSLGVFCFAAFDLAAVGIVPAAGFPFFASASRLPSSPPSPKMASL